MTKPVPNPPRLSRLAESDDAVGVGRMFRGARELADEALPALRWRLRTSLRLRAQRPRLILRLALTVGGVFCTGGMVGAVVSPLLGRKEPVASSPVPAAAPRPARPKSRPQPPLAATPASEPVPVTPELGPKPEALNPVPAPTKHRPARVALLTEPGSPPAPADTVEPAPLPSPPSPIAVEQALLGQAMKRLRDSHDAGAALVLLAEYRERFPQGALSSEATVLRIEALLALGRRGEALAALDGAPLSSLPNRDEQLVVRGELRAANRRWREARDDFAGALRDHDLPAAGAKARSLEERALWGRAAARSRLGDQEGARADLELYLRRFPGGQFAGPAASLLKGAR